MKENGRIVKNNCDKNQFDLFIKRLKKTGELTLKSHKPASDLVLQERYSFSCDHEHISVVLETNSGTLVITAPDHILQLLQIEFDLAAKDALVKPQQHACPEKTSGEHGRALIQRPGGEIRVKESPAVKEPARQSPKPLNKQSGIVEKKDKPASAVAEAIIEKPFNSKQKKEPSANQSKVAPVLKQNQSVAQNTSKNAFVSANVPTATSANVQSAQKSKPQQKPLNTQKTEAALDEQKSLDDLYKNGFAIKKYQPDKLESFFKKLKSLKGVSCRLTSDGDGGRSYLIGDGKNKVYLRYIDAKKTLQLQGKRSKLFGEVQVLISSDSDYVTAVSSHIDLTGEEKRAKDMEKRLKKLLPNAFDFLSEQSRIDLTIGMMDIGNDEVKLSDYSMLLVPPYRGLERLIFDLQRAKGIEVKMIGQAYEKDANGYVLKAGYQRKIGSIVYAEVMSALYTEYFAKRNFYAHSDITGDLLSRVITEKSAVREIFANLARVIEYNTRKLKEIGFTI